MDALTILATFFLLFAPVNGQDLETSPVAFRIQVYPFGGYYSYPPYCPPSYYYGPGYGYYRRGFSFYVGPGYPYYGYNDPRCYYWGRGYRYYGGYRWGNRSRYYRGGYRGGRRHHGHRGGHHRGGRHGGHRH